MKSPDGHPRDGSYRRGAREQQRNGYCGHATPSPQSAKNSECLRKPVHAVRRLELLGHVKAIGAIKLHRPLVGEADTEMRPARAARFHRTEPGVDHPLAPAGTLKTGQQIN